MGLVFILCLLFALYRDTEETGLRDDKQNTRLHSSSKAASLQRINQRKPTPKPIPAICLLPASLPGKLFQRDDFAYPFFFLTSHSHASNHPTWLQSNHSQKKAPTDVNSDLLVGISQAQNTSLFSSLTLSVIKPSATPTPSSLSELQCILHSLLKCHFLREALPDFPG